MHNNNRPFLLFSVLQTHQWLNKNSPQKREKKTHTKKFSNGSKYAMFRLFFSFTLLKTLAAILYRDYQLPDMITQVMKVYPPPAEKRQKRYQQQQQKAVCFFVWLVGFFSHTRKCLFQSHSTKWRTVKNIMDKKKKKKKRPCTAVNCTE